MKKYNIHLVASNDMLYIKNLLEEIDEYNGREVGVSISKWNYSFLSLNYFIANEMNEEPDIMLIFDNARYNQFDGANGKNIGHKRMLEAIKNARINLENSKIVLILSKDKKDDKSLLNLLIKMDIQNFFFSNSNDINIEDLKLWLFTYDKTFDDNICYLDIKDDEDEVFKPVIKYVDKIIEKPIIHRETVKEIVEKERIISKSFGAIIIAIGGTKEGAGATTLAINTASYLSKSNNKKKVALLEMNKKPVLAEMEMDNVDIFHQNYLGYALDKPKNLLNEIDYNRYDYIILDLGALYDFRNEKECTFNEKTAQETEFIYEMNRSHIPVIVHAGGDWNHKYLTPFLISNNNGLYRQWKLILTHTKKIDDDIRREFIDVNLAPYYIDCENEETIEFMGKVFSELEFERIKNKNFFEKIMKRR